MTRNGVKRLRVVSKFESSGRLGRSPGFYFGSRCHMRLKPPVANKKEVEKSNIVSNSRLTNAAPVSRIADPERRMLPAVVCGSRYMGFNDD